MLGIECEKRLCTEDLGEVAKEKCRDNHDNSDDQEGYEDDPDELRYGTVFLVPGEHHHMAFFPGNKNPRVVPLPRQPGIQDSLTCCDATGLSNGSGREMPLHV